MAVSFQHVILLFSKLPQVLAVYTFSSYNNHNYCAHSDQMHCNSTFKFQTSVREA